MSIILRATQQLRPLPAPGVGPVPDPPGARTERMSAPPKVDGVGPQEVLSPETSRRLEDQDIAATAAGDSQPMQTILLDRSALHRANIVDPEGPKSRLAEELRLIKRRLLTQIAASQDNARETAGAVERPDNAIVVTSPSAGEGKTFLALNLAIAIAIGERRKVVLIDGDPIKRSLSILLGLADRPGLIDVLRDPASRDPLLACEDHKLVLLPAGRGQSVQSSAADLFGGARMAALVRRAAAIAGDDGVVLIDAPPVLATSEALALAHQVGRVLMVVAAGRTARSSIGSALDQLDMDERISLVLNRRPAYLSATDMTY